MTSFSLLAPAIARDVLDHALALGADFAELFVERKRRSQLSLLSSQIENISGGLDFGIGVRLCYGHKVLYGYTNLADRNELLRIVTLLAAKDRRDPVVTATAFDFTRLTDRNPIALPLSADKLLEQKIAYLHAMDAAARAESDKVSQFSGNVLGWEQEVEIFNSEGVQVSDRRHYNRIMAQTIALDGGEQSVGYEAPGAMKGWEHAESIDPRELALTATRQALVKLGAAPCPSGKLPVIMESGFGGVIFHEACGHLLETTSVAKKASVFHDKMGQLIANPAVSAVDEGLQGNAWGSINVDDEGMATQHTQLIKDGVLTGFLVDRMGALRTGYARTGSGRRESYKFAPASRMRNTYIEPGNHSLDDMLATVEHGIYAKRMGGGSVQPGTGEFNFNVQEAYLIEGGRITRPLKSATLIGTGPQVLKEISMVGRDLALSAGMCGSVSGSIPASVGQPPLKVDNILVGGNA
ncbi:TldD/PmbA family protein [Aeromonas caviae]|uniref:TldD protein n=1 Tax=Aeromonas caviae TaxID=648 RepID=A0AA37FW31_AERCA|nr:MULTISPECIES: TldD/PmbA family protein [Aeromonas]AUT41726.1 peptidase C69 [Aeromonas sp. ASNIH5]MDX7753418.1 TldD/PmbA family protein [Aeromonas caviae]MDX7773743.1 TldD/PmbA family protein [Aeromonas caviae]WKL87949.1 TldD/PmbA family protein [Aeromonas caviae]BDA17083.1 TldD protein [Aeromonas caviae]